MKISNKRSCTHSTTPEQAIGPAQNLSHRCDYAGRPVQDCRGEFYRMVGNEQLYHNTYTGQVIHAPRVNKSPSRAQTKLLFGSQMPLMREQIRSLEEGHDNPEAASAAMLDLYECLRERYWRFSLPLEQQLAVRDASNTYGPGVVIPTPLRLQ